MRTKNTPTIAEAAMIAVGFAAVALSAVAYSAVLWGARGALHLTRLDRRPAI